MVVTCRAKSCRNSSRVKRRVALRRARPPVVGIFDPKGLQIRQQLFQLGQAFRVVDVRPAPRRFRHIRQFFAVVCPDNRLHRAVLAKFHHIASHAFAVSGKRPVGGRLVVDFKQYPIVLRRDVRHKYDLRLSVLHQLPRVKQRKVFFRQAVFSQNLIPSLEHVRFAFVRQPRAVQAVRHEHIFLFRTAQALQRLQRLSRDFIPFLPCFAPRDAARQKRRIPHIGGEIIADRFAVV